MWADMLNCSLKGKEFRELRAGIMNFPVDYEYDEIIYED